MTNRLIAHLAHVELLTPKLEETLRFFVDLLSMYIVKEEDGSVYLKAWGELGSGYSLKLKQADEPGLGHLSWRADSLKDFEQLANILKNNGSLTGKAKPEFGVGKALSFESPDGHSNEVFWETRKTPSNAKFRSKINARPMKMPNRITAVRRLDHCTLFSSDVKKEREFYQTLGFKYNEGIVSSRQGKETGAFLSVTGQSHDLGILRDLTGARGRLNHVAFYSDNVGLWIEACDAFAENGISVEMGPMRHGITDSLGLYVIEPGGNRVEIYQGGFVNYTPVDDWAPIITDIDSEQGKYSAVWGLGFLAETWLTYGTPCVKVPREVTKLVEKSKESYLARVYGTKATYFLS